jgi:hypothetical protein
MFGRDNLTFNPVLSTTTTLQVQPIPNGIYYVKTTGLNGCYDVDSIKVNNGQVENSARPRKKHLICLGEEVTLFVTNLDPNDQLTYTWTPNLPKCSQPDIIAGDSHQLSVGGNRSSDGLL